MKKPTLWLACSAALTTAYAADWVPIEFDGDGVATYMDKTSIKANTRLNNMKKLLVTLLLYVSSSAFAEWTTIMLSPDSL